MPKVLAWSDDETNPVGAEYIIMEHAAGVLLHEVWDPEMDALQQLKFIKNTCELIKQMVDLEFPAYGSLYFNDATFLEPFQKFDIGEGYCLGPLCEPRLWNSSPGELELYGPRSPDSYGPCMFDFERKPPNPLPPDC